MRVQLEPLEPPKPRNAMELIRMAQLSCPLCRGVVKLGSTRPERVERGWREKKTLYVLYGKCTGHCQRPMRINYTIDDEEIDSTSSDSYYGEI